MRHLLAFVLILLVPLSVPLLGQDAPEAAPTVAPEAASEAAPQAVPEVAPQPTPEAAPEAAPEAPAETTPEMTATTPYVLTARMFELPLWRLNDIFKQHPVALSPAQTKEGPDFLHGVVDAARVQALDIRLSAYGAVREYGKLILKEGEEGGLAIAGQKEIIVGAEPALHPKRGIVFNALKDTARVAGLSLTALCAAAPEGTTVRFNIELLDNIEAGGGNRIAPVVITRSLDITELIPEKGAAVIIPPLSWESVGSEPDPRVQVLLIGLRTAEPADLL